MVIRQIINVFLAHVGLASQATPYLDRVEQLLTSLIQKKADKRRKKSTKKNERSPHDSRANTKENPLQTGYHSIMMNYKSVKRVNGCRDHAPSRPFHYSSSCHLRCVKLNTKGHEVYILSKTLVKSRVLLQV
jgi:hypothetical protein